MLGFDLICCVVRCGDGSKTLKAAKKYGVRGATVTIGRGTVKSHLLEFLEITDVRKEIVTMIIEKEISSEAIRGISEEIAFHKPHHGIGFSLSVSEFISSKTESDKNSNNIEVKNSMYSVIYVVVEKGNAEEVIDAANQAGSRGGTIMNARGAGIHEVQKLFSLDIEPEKEVVFILTKNDLKDGIVESIRSHLNIEEPGHGVMFILDVNEVYGLHMGERV